MKARIFLLVLIGCILAAVVVYWQPTKRPFKRNLLGRSAALISAPVPVDAPVPPKPAKLYHIHNPPANAEEKAMLYWLYYNESHDIQFQWKTPLSFYGRIVDQHDQPVAGATAYLSWNDVRGSKKAETVSDADGRFELVGKTGKVLDVQVGNGKYPAYLSAHQDFEFSDVSRAQFYQPDPSQPVIFRLWKPEGAEPLQRWSAYRRPMPIDGQNKVWFDTRTGKIETAEANPTFSFFDKDGWFDIHIDEPRITGDVAISAKRGPTLPTYGFDWSITIEAAPGAGIVLSDEELMYSAPEKGYQPVWTQEYSGFERSFSLGHKTHFYLKTADGRYAAVEVNVLQGNRLSAEFRIFARVNPSGSRNLQGGGGEYHTDK